MVTVVAGVRRPYVKLCGMSREEDIRAVAQARPDMCGFIVNFPNHTEAFQRSV